MKIILFLTVLFATSLMISQNEINQLDNQGLRHGVWKKTFKGSKQIRYEGAFNHGKEIGIFKFYCSDCKDKPTIIKTFNDANNSAEVQYYTIKGKLVSEGNMIDKNRIGDWVYYHKKSKGIMTKEFYKDGRIDGLKVTFYLNNQIAEELNYKNGLKEGINNYYSPEGVLLKKLFYKNNLLQGYAYYYDAKGNVILEGNYKNNKKNGVWKTFKNKKFIKEDIYPKPIENH